jgi:hypothetical protein
MFDLSESENDTCFKPKGVENIVPPRLSFKLTPYPGLVWSSFKGDFVLSFT